MVSLASFLKRFKFLGLFADLFFEFLVIWWFTFINAMVCLLINCKSWIHLCYTANERLCLNSRTLKYKALVNSKSETQIKDVLSFNVSGQHLFPVIPCYLIRKSIENRLFPFHLLRFTSDLKLERSIWPGFTIKCARSRNRKVFIRAVQVDIIATWKYTYFPI